MTIHPRPQLLPDRSRRIDGMMAAYALFSNLADMPVEIGGIAYLAQDQRLLGLRHIVGSSEAVAIDARRLAIDALSFGARNVVMAHNHPSGNPTPSREDLAHARRLARGLDALGVTLVDHLVLAGAEVTSLRALGYL